VSALSDGIAGPAETHVDRHSVKYRDRFLDITHEGHGRCPIAWTDTYDGTGRQPAVKRSGRHAEDVSDLQRAGPRLGLHAAALTGRPPRRYANWRSLAIDEVGSPHHRAKETAKIEMKGHDVR
jgi:hypothetical protein